MIEENLADGRSPGYSRLPAQHPAHEGDEVDLGTPGGGVTNEEMELLKLRTRRTLPERTYTITAQTQKRLRKM
jgi:hypothetical protein